MAGFRRICRLHFWLGCGRLSVRASVNSYVQYDYPLIHIYNDTSLVRSEVRLIRIAQFVVTVHFMDFNSTLIRREQRNLVQGGSLTVEAYDERGNVGGRGSASVPANAASGTVNVTCAPGTYHLFATFTGRQSGGPGGGPEGMGPISIIKPKMCKQVLVFQWRWSSHMCRRCRY